MGVRPVLVSPVFLTSREGPRRSLRRVAASMWFDCAVITFDAGGKIAGERVYLDKAARCSAGTRQRERRLHPVNLRSV